jgi:carboxymethylenebutenolidase
MTRLTAADFDPEVLKLFDKFVHGLISRRDFLDAAQRFAVAGLSAAGLLAALSPRFAEAQQVADNDPRIQSGRFAFPSPQGYGTVSGLRAAPAQPQGPLPIVLVVHENRGLNPHIEDIARRLALAGFIAYAPDALAPVGGYPGDEDKARELFKTLDPAKTREDFVAAAATLQALPEGNGKVGVVGFCWGGGVANLLATRVPTLAAAVPFYGNAPATADVPRIKAPLLLHFAATDERINAAWPDYEAALKAAGVPYEAYVYPGTQHGFNNNTTPRYDEAAAKLAWGRTIAFFDKYLRG